MKPDEPQAAILVIRVLGVIAVLLTLGGLGLVGYVVQQSSGNRTVDPAAIGAVAGIVGLAGTVIGMFGTLLVNVYGQRSEVTIRQPDDQPIPVEEQSG